MAVTTILATVVDIRRDAPRKEDAFFVDTNGWRNLTYSRIRNARPEYVTYLKKALEANAKLYSCGVTFLELASSIENDEHKIFEMAGNGGDRKIFRHQHVAERKHVLAEIKASWDQVTQFSEVADVRLDNAAIARFSKYLTDCPVDGYDLPIIDVMERRGVLNILTDDCDFAAVAGVTVFTSNSSVIATARRQDRLRLR